MLNNRASDCWRIVPVTVEQPCQTSLKLVKEHFPRNNTFHKIFNKNTIKISYEKCMRNISSMTASHNKSILRWKAKEYGCNCRNKESCPVQNQCLTSKVIYETTVVNDSDDRKSVYFGSSDTTFKERYRNHTRDFNHERCIYVCISPCCRGRSLPDPSRKVGIYNID